jgi:hypothetical protein
MASGAPPETGIKVIEARDPETLTRRVQAYIDAAAGGGFFSPYLQGFELAGSGAGATCRAILTITKNLGWGLNTSMPCALARVLFREAKHSQQLWEVIEQMWITIAGEGGADAFVWQPRIVGTGRDGSYLVGIAWCDGSFGSVLLGVESFPAQGPYTAATNIGSIVIPQTPGGLVETEQTWHVTWGAICNDAAGTGVKLRVELDTVSIWESEEILAATDWDANFGQCNHLQSAAGDSTYDLIVEPTVGGNAVNVRGVSLRAEICNYQNNPS